MRTNHTRKEDMVKIIQRPQKKNIERHENYFEYQIRKYVLFRVIVMSAVC